MQLAYRDVRKCLKRTLDSTTIRNLQISFQRFRIVLRFAQTDCTWKWDKGLDKDVCRIIIQEIIRISELVLEVHATLILFSAWHTNEQEDYVLIGLPSPLQSAINICQLHCDALISQEEEGLPYKAGLHDIEKSFEGKVALDFLPKPIDRFEATLNDLLVTPLSHLHGRKYRIIRSTPQIFEAQDSLRCLVVENNRTTLQSIETVLNRNGFQVSAVCSAEEALQLILTDSFDVLLCDIQLPALSGLDFARLLADIRPNLAITLMSANQRDWMQMEEVETLECDFIGKPFCASELPKILETNFKRRLDVLLEQNRNAQPEMLLHANLLLYSLDMREPNTGEHSRRVSLLALALGEKLGLNARELLYLRCGALLHDIGKVGLKDNALLKKSQLTEEDWDEIRKHPVKGAEMLKQSPSLHPVIDIVLRHHERFDGKGYPDGLQGDQIPYLARIVCVVDAFEAMTSNRFYKNALSESKAKSQLMKESGGQFDPEIVSVFLKSVVTSQTPFLMNPPEVVHNSANSKWDAANSSASLQVAS